jgi:hypothetical protein
MYPKGKLARVIQGATRTPQTVTWLLSDGTPKDLTGATLTGFIRPARSLTTRAITGTLTLIEPESGTFDWDYSEADVGTAGNFVVQFKATFGPESDYSEPAEWQVGAKYG